MSSSEISDRDEAVSAAETQSVFREVNEKIEDVNDAFEPLSGAMQVVCECADTRCVERIDLTKAEYESVRRHPTHFFVLAGHVYPDVERVVERRDGYVVVEKLAADVARAMDPRSD